MSIPSISETRQYLTFQLADEVFALDVSRVREILEVSKATKVPKTPDYMKGVINLRGGVVPVFDMRLKFGLKPTVETVNTCIVVVEVLLEQEATILGALVDSVQEVFELDPEQIEPAPKIGLHLKAEVIKGIGKKGERFIIILDADKVFTCDELTFDRPEEDVRLAGNE